jgi:integrase
VSVTETRTRHAGIFKRGDRYTARVRDRRGRVRRINGATIAEVKAKRAAFETDVARGEWRDQSRMTFAEYAREWVDTYSGRTSRGLRDETRVDYRKRLEQDAIPFLGRMRLAEITPADVRGLARHVAGRGVAPNTVRLALAPAKALLATAVEDGLIRSNPAHGVRIAAAQVVDQEEEHKAKALTEAELVSLIEHTPAEWRLLIRVLGQTGLRISELIALRWSDIDLGHQRIHVRRRVRNGRVGPPKSRYGRRSVPVTPALTRDLWARRKAAEHAQDGDLLFPSATGGFLDRANLHRSVLKPAARAAGVEWAGFHTLRHTCGTLLFRHGLNAKQVQLWLGHHSPAFTLATYVHLLPDDLPIVDVLENVAGGNQVGTRPAETSRNPTQARAAETA